MIDGAYLELLQSRFRKVSIITQNIAATLPALMFAISNKQ